MATRWHSRALAPQTHVTAAPSDAAHLAGPTQDLAGWAVASAVGHATDTWRGPPPGPLSGRLLLAARWPT